MLRQGEGGPLVLLHGIISLPRRRWDRGIGGCRGVIEVTDELVRRITLHTDLVSALAAAGPDASDELPIEPPT